MPILRQHAPTDLGDPTSVPEGLILGINSVNSIPSGWTEWTDANGYFLCGTNDDLQVGTTEVSGINNPFLYTDPKGNHTGISSVNIEGFGSEFSAGSPLRSPRRKAGATDSHTHLSTSEDLKPANTDIKLVQAGATATTDNNLIGFSTEELLKHTAVSTYDDATGDVFLRANTTEGAAGVTLDLDLSEEDDTHVHYDVEDGTADSGINTVGDGISSGGGPHTHTFTLNSLTNNMYRITMRAFRIFYLNDIKGLIGMWATTAAIPSGWELVATADERYINITADGDGTLSGDGTIDFDGITDTVSHSHTATGSSDTGVTGYGQFHTDTVGHAHDVSETANVAHADRYYVKFIRKL